MGEASNSLQLAFLIPVVITIVGWFVVARQADRREFRKEVREQIKDLRAACDSVREKAAEYWLKSTKTTAAAAAVALKAELKRLARFSAALAAAGLQFESARLLADVRELATGGDFEARDRKRDSDADSERVSDLTGVIEDLLTAVDTAFYEEFGQVKSRRWARWVPIGAPLFLSSDQ